MEISNSARTAQTIHGTLVSVQGLGVLFVGDSGTGKSRRAIRLVSLGHQLVADDVVIIERVGGKLVGRAPDRIAGLIEINGLGIVDVRDLFGPAALTPSCVIAKCVELGFDSFFKYDELVRNKGWGISGVRVPLKFKKVRYTKGRISQTGNIYSRVNPRCSKVKALRTEALVFGSHDNYLRSLDGMSVYGEKEIY